MCFISNCENESVTVTHKITTILRHDPPGAQMYTLYVGYDTQRTSAHPCYLTSHNIHLTTYMHIAQYIYKIVKHKHITRAGADRDRAGGTPPIARMAGGWVCDALRLVRIGRSPFF